MLKNPNYVYGEGIAGLPSHLNFGQFIVEKFWNYGDKIALINGVTDERLTFREMVKSSMNIALSLTRMGVKRGDTIAICSENRKEYWSAFIGTSCTGATFTAASIMYTKDELKHVLNISKPKIIFCSPLTYKSYEETLRDLPFIDKVILFGKDRVPGTILYDDLVSTAASTAAATPTTTDTTPYTVNDFIATDVVGQIDTAVILYSSGTTGLPKGVMLTHVNAITNCLMSNFLNPMELTLTIIPWYHVMGLMGILTLFASGCTIVYLPKFDCDIFLKTMEKYRVAQLLVPPPVLVAISKFPGNHDVNSVNLIYSGAAPLKSDTIEGVKKRFPNVDKVIQGYGMTEVTLCVTADTYNAIHLAKPGGVGRAIPGIIIKVVDIETRKPLGANQQGEICTKGPTIMKGYIGKDRSDDFDDEGFYKTGDIGYYDDDKCFFIVDRLKELIKYKGYQVPPAEIEAVLLRHPDVLDAGVIGVPDDHAGELPRAYVVLQSGANSSEEDIKSFVAEKLSNPKRLRGGVCFVNSIPKNASGKILRRTLREMVKQMENKN